MGKKVAGLGRRRKSLNDVITMRDEERRSGKENP